MPTNFWHNSNKQKDDILSSFFTSFKFAKLRKTTHVSRKNKQINAHALKNIGKISSDLQEKQKKETFWVLPERSHILS